MRRRSGPGVGAAAIGPRRRDRYPASRAQLTDEQLLQQELARPTERTNTRICREHAEDKARRAAERKAETMEQQLEARLRRLIAEGREAGFKALGEVLEVLARNEKKVAELQEKIDAMRGRDGVSVQGAAINHKGELMLTLSDGTILTPGRITARANDRPEFGDVIDLPNPLARRYS